MLSSDDEEGSEVQEQDVNNCFTRPFRRVTEDNREQNVNTSYAGRPNHKNQTEVSRTGLRTGIPFIQYFSMHSNH
jgi:hypothetical protein